MATLPELRPNGDVSTTTSIPWVNDGTDTLMWQAIDDDVDSPDPADYADSSTGLYAGTAVLELTATPANFDNMDTISIAGFFMKTGVRDDDNVVYYVKVANAGDTVDYVDEIQIAASDAGGDDTGVQAAGTVNAAGIAASKGDWDGARLHIRVAATKVKNWNSGTFGFEAIEVRGTYTSAAAIVEMGYATLASSAQSLNVKTDQTISMGAITLASSPQALNVSIGITISMQAISVKALFPIGSPVNIKGDEGMTAWHPADYIYQGAADWSNLDNMKLEDGEAANVSIPGFAGAGNLFFEDHSFTISEVPSGAIIVGVEVQTKRAAQVGGKIYEATVRLLAGGSAVGISKDNFDWWALYGAGIAGERHSWRAVTLGGPTDDWSANLTDAQVRASNFGFRFQALNGDVAAQTAEVDFHVIRVYWTLSQTITMGAVTLASSPQALTVEVSAPPPRTIPMVVATLASSSQRITSPVVSGYVTGWKHPGTATSETRAGSSAGWTNPDNVKISDIATASSAIGIGEYTDWLRCVNFGFTASDIPAGASIDGIEILFEARGAIPNISDSEIWLRDSGGQAGDEGADAANWPTDSSPMQLWVRGGSADDWGADLAQADVIASTFGFDLSAESDAAANTALIDSLWVRVYYTIPSTTLEELSPPDLNYYIGPYSASSALYMIGLRGNNNTRLTVWKTTGDPTVATNWVQIDAVVAHPEKCKSVWGVLDGTTIHIAAQDLNGDIWYSEFETSTDTWATRKESAYTASYTPAEDFLGCSIGIRSDGDKIIVFTAIDVAGDYSVKYVKHEGASWDAATWVSTLDTDDYIAGIIVMGASDRTHFFYFDDTNNDILHRSINSSNIFDTEQIADADVSSTAYHEVGRGVAYVDNGDTIVKAPHNQSSTLDLVQSRFVSEATPTINTDQVNGNPAWDQNETIIACHVLHGTDVYCLASENPSADLYLYKQADGGSWSLVTELHNGVTCNRVSAAVYVRSGDKIGYIWVDGTTVAYDEYALGAIIPMGAITLASSPQTALAKADQTIAMAAATLASSAQALTVAAVAPITISMQAVTLASSAQGLNVLAGAVSAQMGTASLVSSAQGLNVLTGAISVPMSAATLVSSAQTLSVVTGAVTVPMGAASLVSAAQTLDVKLDVTIQLDAITLVGSAQALTIIPGAVTAVMQAVTLASSSQALAVEVAQIVPLSAATLVGSAQSLAAISGAVTVPLSAITLVGAAQTLDVDVDEAISFSAATLVGSAQTLTVIPGAVAVPLSATTLVSSAQTLDVDVAETISLSTITLVGSPQALAVAAGAVTVPLSAATLVGSAQDLRVETDKIVVLSTATLASSPQALIVLAEGAPQTIEMSAAILVSSPQALTLAFDQTLAMGYTTLVSDAQGLDVLAGAISIEMGYTALVSGPQTLDIITGAISVPLGAIALVSSAQTLTVLATGTPQTISMGYVTLVSSAQTLDVDVDQIVFMDYATLVSSAQALDVEADQVVSMGYITLASSPQTLAPIGGAVSLSLSTITLASSPQGLTVLAEGAPQTIVMGYETLVSSPQALNVETDQIIAMGYATLVSSAQGLSVSSGAVSVGTSTITLASSAQSLTVSVGIAPVTVSLNAITLVSAAQALTVIPGGVIVQISSITLVSSAQTLSLAAGAIGIPLSEATLVSSAQALTVSIGAVNIQMGTVTLIASPQGLVVIPGATAVVMGVVILVAVAEPVVAWAGGIFWYTEVIRRVSFVTLIVEPTSFITAAVSEASNVTRQVNRTSILDSELVEA